MKVLGIIAEYNPFHNGHRYQLDQAKASTGADFVVIVMSGDFVQRGTPAIIDKYTRAQMALTCGADLVLELPALWATASAEYFGAAAVAMLDKLGVVDTISFGAESDNIILLNRIAEILVDEPAQFQYDLFTQLKEGRSFPTARKNALLNYLGASAELETILATPNNILAIEYLKELKRRNSAITPQIILRQGGGYHDTAIQSLASATAIRRAAFTNPDFEAELEPAMPESARLSFMEYCTDYALLDENDFSAILKYKLLSEAANGFADYADGSVELSNRIKKHFDDFVSYTDFCDLLKSKDVTYTRISRLLLHILLNFTNWDYRCGRAMDYIPYLRVLGFKKDSGELLHAIKNNASIPMISKPANATALLQNQYTDASFACRMFEQDVFAADVYTSVLTNKISRTVRGEYNHGLVLL